MSDASGYQVSIEAARRREQYSARYFIGPWTPGLVALAALRTGERVLDLACGTGIVARLAAASVAPGGNVTGLDINAAMLAVARSVETDVTTPIAWVEGSAVALPFKDESFDVILCQQGLQFFPEKKAALREMHRVLARGGRALMSVWKSPGPYNHAVADALERHLGPNVATRFRASRRVPDGVALRDLLSVAGFTAVEVRPCAMTIHLPPMESFVLGHLSGMPIAEAVAALNQTQKSALVAEIKTSLAPYADANGITVPDEVNVAIGQK